nr:DUF3846 domain-containing protein [Leucobacter sp. cx-169]
MQFILIPADDAAPRSILTVEDPEQTLEILQTAVGGNIEFIDLVAPDANMYLNEEGKLLGLPLNNRATTLARKSIPMGDFIVGDVVIVGAIDDSGDETSAPPALLNE